MFVLVYSRKKHDPPLLFLDCYLFSLGKPMFEKGSTVWHESLATTLTPIGDKIDSTIEKAKKYGTDREHDGIGFALG